MAKKKLILVFGLMLLALNISFVAVYFLLLSSSPDSSEPVSDPVAEEEMPPAPQIQELSDEYYSIHFNYGDAIELCSMETRSRNSNLIQLSVNEHSTRFKEEENIYLVKLDTHVGTPLVYDEKTHTCEIDPTTQGVAFYKEITRRKAVRPQ